MVLPSVVDGVALYFQHSTSGRTVVYSGGKPFLRSLHVRSIQPTPALGRLHQRHVLRSWYCTTLMAGSAGCLTVTLPTATRAHHVICTCQVLLTYLCPFWPLSLRMPQSLWWPAGGEKGRCEHASSDGSDGKWRREGQGGQEGRGEQYRKRRGLWRCGACREDLLRPHQTQMIPH